MITDAVNFMFAVDKEEAKKAFVKEALLLKQALSLCGSMVEKEKRLEAAFLEAVRTLVVHLSST